MDRAFLIGLAAFLIGGAAGRIRGSDIGGAALCRFGVWGGSVALLVLISTGNYLYAGASLVLAGLGASEGYFGGQFDVIQPQNQNWRNYAKLTISGMFRFLPLFAASFAVDLQWKVLPAVLAGVSFVPAYFLGAFVVKYLKLPLLKSFTEWGEFFFWGTIYFALYCGMAYGTI